MREGVTTLEIKSGYGLDGSTERRQLSAARALSARHGVKVSATFLGAHGVPREYQPAHGGKGGDAYVDEVVLPTMSELKAAGLVDAVDAFDAAHAIPVRAHPVRGHRLLHRSV